LSWQKIQQTIRSKIKTTGCQTPFDGTPLVRAGHSGKRRPGSGTRRSHRTRSKEDRRLFEAFGAAQPAAPVRSVPFGAVDADFLHESGRQNLPAGQRKTLQHGKVELRKQFGRE